jgi:hypothetical protein
LTTAEEWSIPDAERHVATPLASGDAHSADFAATVFDVVFPLAKRQKVWYTRTNVLV